MNMKWSMSFLAFSGALAYALIFLAQSDGDTVADADARADSGAATLPSVAQPVEPALMPAEAVESQKLVTVEAAPLETSDGNPVVFEDPWTVGVRAFDEGDLDVAAAALQASVEERPNSAYRHYLLGLTFRRRGELETAVAELERSRTLSPATVKTLVALGRTHLDRGALDEAREAIDRALDADLGSADAWHVLGRIENTLGNFEESEAAFRGAVSRDPAHAWAWNNLGYLYIQRGDFDAARDALLHAVQSPNADAVFFNNLGVAYERTESLERAALAYAKADLLGSEASVENHERVAQRLTAAGFDFASADSVESMDSQSLLAALAPDVEESDTEVAQWVGSPEAIQEPDEDSKD